MNTLRNSRFSIVGKSGFDTIRLIWFDAKNSEWIHHTCKESTIESYTKALNLLPIAKKIASADMRDIRIVEF